MQKQNIGSPKCHICNKTSYPLETVNIGGVVMHDRCFKCDHCKKKLLPGNYTSQGGAFFCRPHYEQLFKAKGNYKIVEQSAACNPQPSSVPVSERSPNSNHDSVRICDLCGLRLGPGRPGLALGTHTFHQDCARCRIAGCSAAINETFCPIQVSRAVTAPYCPTHGERIKRRLHEAGEAPKPFLSSFSGPAGTHPWFKYPKEIYELILLNLQPKERNLLRSVCQDLYKKLTSWAPAVPTLSYVTQTADYSDYSWVWPQIKANVTVPASEKQTATHVSLLVAHPDGLECPQNQVQFQQDENTIHLNFRQFRDMLFWSDQKPRDIIVQPVLVNHFGATRGPGLQRTVRVTEQVQYYCFNGEAQIQSTRGLVSAQDIRKGDTLIASNGEPTIVQHVKTTPINAVHRMCHVDDFYLTPGHPIYQNNDWYRPDELYPITPTYIDTLYNFHCHPHHFLLVGSSQVICGSLGGICPRLAASDPISDYLYGSGYNTPLAVRYSWLNTLTTRIPDHLVEEETDKYWAHFNNQTICVN